ncbi:hypothetical protein [Vulgatibacter incomptus]|uniref:Uncharacterized protein n=1 Tax=Vulgatibacter incomptus TaxID=1391653 RepID=A0A0K1PC86_9BACT|nr:hypothetical protein [Vulgatibacter incomptus]AKU91135.1 hypothetical protein AKJ08_1522 [Vulgatibacter incomptus]
MRRIAWVVAFSSVLIGCRGGEPSRSGNEQQTPLQVALRASARSVEPGGPVDLSWTVRSGGQAWVSLADASGWSDPVSPVDSIRVNPVYTTEYVLRAFTADQESGEARVTIEVVPQLEPTAAVVVDPGAQQRFWITGTNDLSSKRFRWSASGGTLEPGFASALWTAPTVSGQYTIRVGLPAGADIVHRVEVRTSAARGQPLAGAFGQPDARTTKDVVAASDGSLWALGQRSLLRREPGSMGWRSANDGLDFRPMKIAPGPDGSVWVTGGTNPPGSSRLEVAHWDPVEAQWIRELGPWDSSGIGRLVSVSADGAVVVSSDGGRIWSRAAGASTWVRLPDPGVSVSGMFLTADHGLVVHCRGGPALCPSELIRLVMAGGAWEPLPPPRNDHVGSDSNGRLFAWGNQGLLRLGFDGAWEDLSEGLPSPRSLRDIAYVPDRYIAATEQGLFVRDEGGVFSPFVAAPPVRSDRYTTESLLALGDGDVLLLNGSGMWRLPAGGDAFLPAAAAGDPAGGLAVTALALGPEGTAAIAASNRQGRGAAPLLFLRAKGSSAWLEASVETEAAAPILQVAFEEDQSVLARSERQLLRVGLDGNVVERISLDGLPEDFRLDDLVTAADGTRYVVASGQLFELTRAGARTIELGHRIGPVAVAPDGTLVGDSANGPLSVEPRDGTSRRLGVWPISFRQWYGFHSVQVDKEGTVWATTYDGVLRLEEGAWRPAGSGPCSFQLVTLHVGADGNAYCADDTRLYVFDGRKRDWVPLSAPFQIGAITWSGNRPTAMATAPDGTLWLGFNEGGVLEMPVR